MNCFKRISSWGRVVLLGVVAATRSELANAKTFLLRSTFLFVVVASYSQLWLILIPDDNPLGPGPTLVIWYCAIAQVFWVPAGSFTSHLDTQIRGAGLDYQLLSPAMLTSWFGNFMGQRLGTTLLTAPVAALIALAMAGPLPMSWMGWLGLALAWTSCQTIYFLVTVTIGMSAFWLGNVGPLQTIWHRLVLMFGGVLMPIPLIPGWVGDVAQVLPFRLLINDPLLQALRPARGVLVSVLTQQIMFSVALLVCCVAMAQGLRRAR